MSSYFFGGFSAYLIAAVGPPVEPAAMLLQPGMVRRALHGEVDRQLQPVRGGRRTQCGNRPACRVRDAARRARHRRADGVGAARIVGRRRQRVVAPLAVDPPDRVDRREIQHVETHVPDARQVAFHVGERAVPRRVVAHAAREHLVPAGEGAPIERSASTGIGAVSTRNGRSSAAAISAASAGEQDAPASCRSSSPASPASVSRNAPPCLAAAARHQSLALSQLQRHLATRPRTSWSVRRGTSRSRRARPAPHSYGDRPPPAACRGQPVVADRPHGRFLPRRILAGPRQRKAAATFSCPSNTTSAVTATMSPATALTGKRPSSTHGCGRFDRQPRGCCGRAWPLAGRARVQRRRPAGASRVNIIVCHGARLSVPAAQHRAVRWPLERTRTRRPRTPAMARPSRVSVCTVSVLTSANVA